MTDFEFYEVGGCVRDALLGVQSKDIDFTAVDRVSDLGPFAQGSVKDSFTKLKQHLEDEGYEIFLSSPEYLTVRARFPKGHPLARTTADFVLARCEGPYSDGRRPDWVLPGTLDDDLARRDFTVNAMARTIEGELIDPHGGQKDLENHLLRFVGVASDRLREDPLRAFRALRFSITKNMKVDPEAMRAIVNLEWDDFSGVSTDRIRDELEKCFKHDTFLTLCRLDSDFVRLSVLAFSHRKIRLIPSMKER